MGKQEYPTGCREELKDARGSNSGQRALDGRVKACGRRRRSVRVGLFLTVLFITVACLWGSKEPEPNFIVMDRLLRTRKGCIPALRSAPAACPHHSGNSRTVGLSMPAARQPIGPRLCVYARGSQGTSSAGKRFQLVDVCLHGDRFLPHPCRFRGARAARRDLSVTPCDVPLLSLPVSIHFFAALCSRVAVFLWQQRGWCAPGSLPAPETQHCNPIVNSLACIRGD